jgi:peptide/nickel transport system permease protein
LLRRLASVLTTFLGITLLAFCAVRLAPGDPAWLRPGEDAGAQGPGPEAAARFRAEHLLDRPLAVQYLDFLGPFDWTPRGHRWFGGSGEHPYGGLVLLDLGEEYQRPSVGVRGEIARRLAVTAPLAAAALALALLVAVPLAVSAAARARGVLDRAAGAASLALYALPTFWLALLLALALGSAGLGWLPAVGLRSKDAAEWGAFERGLDLARHALLPVAALAAGLAAYLFQQVRSGMAEALAAEWVRTARAKGLSERAVLWRHAARAALVPLVPLAAAIVPGLLGGSVVVERVFDLPGLGSYALDGLLARDYPVVQGTAACAALITLAASLSSEWLLARLDRRTAGGA